MRCGNCNSVVSDVNHHECGVREMPMGEELAKHMQRIIQVEMDLKRIIGSFNKREQELVARVNHLEQFIASQDKQLARDFSRIAERFAKLEMTNQAKNLLQKNISQQHLEKKLAEKNERIKELEVALDEMQKNAQHWVIEHAKIYDLYHHHMRKCQSKMECCT